MNPYIYPVTCSICGGEGMTDNVTRVWINGGTHRDPEVCRRNIEEREQRKREQTDRLIRGREFTEGGGI